MNNIDFELELYNRFGQIKDFTLGMRIGQYFYELGCHRTAEKFDKIEYNRQRAEEPISDETSGDLEEAAEEYAKDYPADRPDQMIAEYSFIAGAKWQAEQNDKELSEKIAAAYQLGLADKEEQMLKEAVEGEVYMSFAPGHNQMVMADVDLPVNTKVKLIIVKEEEK